MTNRAFTELYPAEIETAEYVETLLRLGAIIVGKSKMCSFAAGENPGDWIDSHCPVNPRGDQYQSPGSSTAGGGASLAGYSWLDYSIGTDIGFLSRKLDSLQELVRDTTNLKEPKTFPTRILYPKEFFPVANGEQQILLENYVCVLENHLKTSRTDFSLIDRWARCPPAEAEGKSLNDYLGNSTYHQYYYDAYHEYDGFRKEYRDTYGREAYVGPLVRYRWNKGASLTIDERNQGKAQLAVFRQWFHENVLKQDSESLSDSVLVLPEGKAVPEYRDDAVILEILGENTLAMVLELPHLVLPIGQNSYESRASGRTEHRPVSGSLVGAKGSDLMLIKLAYEAFESACWQTEVQTGRSNNAVQHIKLVTHGICYFASTAIGDLATATASTHVTCGSTIRVSNLETLPANSQEQKDRFKSVCNSSILDMITVTHLRQDSRADPILVIRRALMLFASPRMSHIRTSTSVPTMFLLFFLLSLFAPSSQAKPLNKLCPNTLNHIPNNDNALMVRSLTHTKTINVTRTRVLAFNLFTTHGTAYQLSSATITQSYRKTVREFNAGIHASVESAKFARKVLGAAVRYQYGNLQMEMRFFGLEPALESVVGFVRGKWTWDTVTAVGGYVEDFLLNGLGGSIRMVLELASGVWVYVVFGLPMGEWLGRGGLHVP
ncbi:MAG: hypothetical protein LQ349_005714 [Xanthoria aureola]|nr:MAG: hypothetical protein LQ349_005714 [Xanthoria aureola]